MPITTVNIPEDLLKYIDSLVAKGVARSKQEVIIKALQNYRKFHMHEWHDPLIIIRGFRRALINQRSLNEILKKFSEEELYEIGKKMGFTLKDSCLASFGVDSTNRENWELALKLLEDNGWGIFKIEKDKNNKEKLRIIIYNPFFPKKLLHGYLETALGVKFSLIPTVEDVAILETVTE